VLVDRRRSPAGVGGVEILEKIDQALAVLLPEAGEQHGPDHLVRLVQRRPRGGGHEPGGDAEGLAHRLPVQPLAQRQVHHAPLVRVERPGGLPGELPELVGGSRTGAEQLGQDDRRDGTAQGGIEDGRQQRGLAHAGTPGDHGGGHGLADRLGGSLRTAGDGQSEVEQGVAVLVQGSVELART
jgi:hypothetical protein